MTLNIEKSKPPRIVIVGGGISGLATAMAIFDLAKKRGLPAPNLQILESEGHPGGKIRTYRSSDFCCEWSVNGFLNKEPKTLEFCQRIDLTEKLLPASTAFTNRYIFTRGRLRKVQMHPVKFIFSRVLPWRGKFRLFREPWITPKADFSADESIADFARRRIGQLAFQTLVDPMQTGIYAGNPEQLSVAACFPRVVEVEKEYGSLIKGMAKLPKERKQAGEPLPGAGPRGHLTSFRNGMQTLIDQLANLLDAKIRYRMKVTDIIRDEHGYKVLVEDEPQPIHSDAVVLACPAYSGAEIVKSLDEGLHKILCEIPYPPMAVMGLGFLRANVKHPMNGFGYLVPRQEQLRILGALWTSTLFPERAPDGHVLIRVMLGGSRDPGILEIDDEKLIDLVLKELTRVQGPLGEPCFSKVFRHRFAIPQYTLGHHQRLKRIEERLEQFPGLEITGNAFRGVSVNDCIRNSWPTAERVLDSFLKI